MDTLFNFIYGPMVWVAFIVFIAGTIYQIISFFIQTRAKEGQILSYMSLKFGLRSLLVWITPFATVNMRKHPVFTILTFLFHLSLIVSPLLLSAHVMMADEAFNIGWVTIPDRVADIMTMIVMICGLFLIARRIKPGITRYVTTPQDYVILLIVLMPFVTGFLAYHQIGTYKWMILLHMLSGEIMLMAIPFTKLNHMIIGVFTRSYIGSEFGGVRHAKDW